MNHRAFLLALTFAALPAARSLEAQSATASGVFAQGLQAYQNLELSSAARLFRLALSVNSADSLSTGERADALMYLYAAEVLASHRDSANAVSLRLLALNPRYEADALVFPPEIVTALERRRRDVKIVLARIEGSAVLRPREEPFRVALVATSFHPIVAVVAREDGAPFVTIYDGTIEDSLDVTWNGLDPDGNDAPTGRYTVNISSRDSRGRSLRTVRVPFDVRSTPAAVAAAPAETPETAPVSPGAPSSLAFSAGAGAGLYSATSGTAAGDVSLSGIGLAGEGTLSMGRFGLRLGYGEASLSAKGDATADRKQVEGLAMLGVRTLPFLTFWIGPHARAWTSDAGNQRWLMWEIRAEVRHQLTEMLGLAVAGWSVAQGSVDASSPFDKGIGAMGRLDMRLGGSPLVAAVSYRLERARIEQDLQREANNVLSFWLRYEPRR